MCGGGRTRWTHRREEADLQIWGPGQSTYSTVQYCAVLLLLLLLQDEAIEGFAIDLPWPIDRDPPPLC